MEARRRVRHEQAKCSRLSLINAIQLARILLRSTISFAQRKHLARPYASERQRKLMKNQYTRGINFGILNLINNN